MAAGRHGGYRDNEFRSRESDLDVPRREFGYSKRDYDRIRDGNQDYERVRVRDRNSRDRSRVRQKDVKERGVMNGERRSVSSRSDSGSSDGGSGGSGGGAERSGFVVRDVDREPGELSSESGSDGAMDTDSELKDVEAKKLLVNGNHSPVQSKKRKFSPIIWDRDDKEVSRTVKTVSLRTTSSLPPQPPTVKSNPTPTPKPHQDIAVQDSPTKESKIQHSPVAPAEPNITAGTDVASVAESLVDVALPQNEERSGSEQEAQTFQEAQDDEYLPTRTIKFSRWATDADSPADEGEISNDDEIPKSKKRKSAPESTEFKGNRKSLTPELGELRRDAEGTRTRSSGSDERVRSSSRDSYADNDVDNNDYMDVAKDRNYDGTSASHSDTDSEDDHVSRGTPDPAPPQQRSVNMLQGCRSVDEFERLNKIDEGTYGVVYRAKDNKTGEIVALKKVKMEKEREGFPLTSLREINILLSFHHPSIVDVKEVVVGNSLDSIFMVMEYMEHDLKALMESMKQPFSQSEVKCLMLQLLEGIKYLHDNWVLHRDLKTSNLLLNNRGELKICDFGLARQYGSPLKPYTQLVVTLWYRAPELLLGAKQYSTAIDMWSLGCIMAELLSKEPLFNGKSEIEQLDKIFKILGTPNETIWPGFSKLPGVKINFVKHQYNLLRKKFPATPFNFGTPVLSDAGFDLLNRLLTYDPEKRITADEALNHEWFREVPLPKSKEFMPTFPAQHDQDRRVRRVHKKSPDPLEELRRKELQQGEFGNGGLFG
nr:cyclin-dependent kinase G-2 isoform X1 [Ipomoea trifida]